ncbi:imidazolonepropionase [candidate division TA06 bacterium]|nr:imidazolonepropionase [candidate division TA06 bacterium]
MEKADLVVKGAKELLTLGKTDRNVRPTGPRRGREMSELGIVEDGALAVRDGKIVFVGKTQELKMGGKEEINASGRVVLPGFIDSHTHLIFAGSREKEFERRLLGESYQEIAEGGGGILSTVKATRDASRESLFELGRNRLDEMLQWGTTTVEVKSGYGLRTEDEIKILEVIQELNRKHSIDLVPTFLGGHEVPIEYRGNKEGYIRKIEEEMLPQISKMNLASFCDVFCEEGVFDYEESRRILKKGKEYGLKPKIHADELSSSGGADLAGELGAISADHLTYPSEKGLEGMRRNGTIAVLLPGTSLFLRSETHAPARRMIEMGIPVALATDFNPGSSPILFMPIIFGLASLLMRMTPAEVITAGTINGAYAVGKGERVGSLEVGKDADFLILNIDHYRQLPYWFGQNLVEKVVKKGKVVWNRSRV